MQKYVLVLTSSTALLAGSALAASAQQSDIPSMGEQLAQAEHSPESEDEPGSMMGHVWTVPAVQEESDYQRSVRVRSCIRKFDRR